MSRGCSTNSLRHTDDASDMLVLYTDVFHLSMVCALYSIKRGPRWQGRTCFLSFQWDPSCENPPCPRLIMQSGRSHLMRWDLSRWLDSGCWLWLTKELPGASLAWLLHVTAQRSRDTWEGLQGFPPQALSTRGTASTHKDLRPDWKAHLLLDLTKPAHTLLLAYS